VGANRLEDLEPDAVIAGLLVDVLSPHTDMLSLPPTGGKPSG
jgi:hypothetical protein